MSKVFWLYAVFAIAVFAGCSSPLPTGTNSPAGHLTGTMSDWSSGRMRTRGSRHAGDIWALHDRCQDSGAYPHAVSLFGPNGNVVRDIRRDVRRFRRSRRLTP
jgi:hypothetical protein